MNSPQVGSFIASIVMVGLLSMVQVGHGKDYSGNFKMPKTRIDVVTPENATALPSPASYGMLVDKKWLYITGQTGTNLDGTMGKDFAEQADNCLANAWYLVQAAGCEYYNVVKVYIYMKDIKNLPAFNEIFKKYYKEPYPPRTTIQAVLVNDALVEFDLIAACGKLIKDDEYSDEDEY